MSHPNHFVILREAGGIGDVVRTFPVARGLKKLHPGSRVDYVCLAGYEGLVRLSPDVDRVFTVTEGERRPRDATPDPGRFPYLRRFFGTTSPQRSQSTQRTTEDLGGSSSVISVSSVVNDVPVGVIDLYCPAYRHEVETGGAVTLDRVELFCREAGVETSTPRIDVPEGAAEFTRSKLRRFHGTGRQPQMNADRHRSEHLCASVSICGSIVGLAPYATHIIRGLPSKEQVMELARTLRASFGEGTRFVFFHSWKCARPGREEVCAADIGAYPALKLPWPELAATVAACDLVVSVDTGIFHLAGALGVPTVGLFGPTSGEVMCRPYPTHSWITASERLPGCAAPCYGRPERGYSKDVCGRVGCGVMQHRRPSA